MHILWMALLGLIAFAWVAAFIEVARGVLTIPSLEDTAPLKDSECPTVSVLFAGRDEAEKMPDAIETMLALDYPKYEVIAVDDRSSDATGAILETNVKKEARLKAVRVDTLPAGWLGKPHALQQAYERSTGEWLVFTDADVHFAPDLLRRAVALAEGRGWEHLTILGAVKMFTFGEKVVMTFFAIGFLMGTKPWKSSNPRSSGYTGVGAFQLIRRSAYETIGTHRRLAMEVIDDMKLGKLVKDAGLRSGVARGQDSVSVHWHAGLGNMIRGSTKNFFASSGFKLWVTTAQTLGLLLMFVFPVAALPFARGWALIFASISVGLPLLVATGVTIGFRISPMYAVLYPVGALIFAWMLTRSTIITLWQGGVVWRGTFYPLEELKRGIV